MSHGSPAKMEDLPSPPTDDKAAPPTPVRRPSEKKKKDTATNKTPAAIRKIKAAEETATQARSGTQDAEAPGSTEPNSPIRGKDLDCGRWGRDIKAHWLSFIGEYIGAVG